MRLFESVVNVAALACGSAVIAMLAVLVAAFEFLGLFIVGLVILVISYTVELEDGSAQNPGLLAIQQLDQSKNPEEWVPRLAERRERLSALQIAKLIGFVLVASGALGFYFVQM